jgi:hypothetical protein
LAALAERAPTLDGQVKSGVQDGEMVHHRRHRVGIARLQRGQERFRLTPQMIEIGTGGEILSHGKFSMLFAWIRNRRHEERAIT